MYMVSSALACLGFRVFDSVGQGYYFLGFVFYHPPAHLVPSHFLSSPSSCCPSFRAASSVFLFSFGRGFFLSLLLRSFGCLFLCCFVRCVVHSFVPCFISYLVCRFASLFCSLSPVLCVRLCLFLCFCLCFFGLGS